MAKALVTILVIFLPLIANIQSSEVLDLGGDWLVKDATNGNYNDLPAKVPGGIYSDLMTNAIIGDIFYGSNDTETRWVAKTNWTYYRDFNVDANLLEFDNVNIVFEGLDTFAVVLINEVDIGRSQNMFVRYIFDAKNALKVGTNRIEVRFSSSIEVAQNLATAQSYVIPPECPPNEYNGDCHVNQIRKMQASYSWDWGPSFPSMGIWKPVYLESFSTATIRYVTVDYDEVPDGYWSITVTTYFDAGNAVTVRGEIDYTLQTDVENIQETARVDHTSTDGELKLEYTFTIPEITVRLWWPNGHGDQNLYNLTTEFVSGEDRSAKTIRIGFRTIELVQEPIGTGLSFYFKVNSRPIFAKGANEIPLDVLPERGQHPDLITRVLKSARDANMNMLRVWGGGLYESDYFYDKADEYGLLIWQDFMFACALYPTYPDFLNNVLQEVKHQVLRLSHHASVALWAGNNENEAALIQNWYGSDDDFDRYKADYIALYVNTIKPGLMGLLSNKTIFLTSSPTDGKESDRQGYVASEPGDPNFGDVHIYNYVFDSLLPSSYPIPRFASEYGYQSLPELDAWLTTTNDLKNLTPNSDFINHRQHHPNGFVENSLLIQYQLSLDDFENAPIATYIYYSQLVQALSVKYESVHYRSYMGRLNEIDQGNTMGALFWQLNDVWVAPTWSGMDFTGKWKMLQYFAKDFFAPTILTSSIDVLDNDVTLQIIAISEGPNDNQNLAITVELYKFDTLKPGALRLQMNRTIECCKAVPLDRITISSTLLNQSGCGSTIDEFKRQCFLHLSVENSDVPSEIQLFGKLKDAELQPAKVEIAEIVENGDNRFNITIRSDAIALYVWLNSHEIKGQFSQNGFVQISDQKVVTFVADSPTTLASLQETLTVTHLKEHMDFVEIKVQ